MNTKTFSRFLSITSAAIILTVGVGFSSLAADNMDDYAKKISAAPLFSQRVMWVGTTAPDASETSDLYVAMGLDPERKVDPISSIEGFIQAHPDSPWTPSLRANLARYYRTIGKYDVALDYWQKAWDATRDLRDANARKVADYTLAYWTGLLSNLGRIDKLQELIRVVNGRSLSTPEYQRLFEVSCKSAAIMQGLPGESFRCGNVALYHVASALDPGGDYSGIEKLESPATGFSIAQLMDLSDQYGLGLTAVKRPSGSELVVPSVVHWKESHYAAIVEKHGATYRVIDPTFGRPQWLPASTINENASGYFLVRTNQVPAVWKRISKEDAKAIFGKGLDNAGAVPPGPQCDADGNPCTTGQCPFDCPPGGGTGGGGPFAGGDGPFGGGGEPFGGGGGSGNPGCPTCQGITGTFGMPDWQVQEPYISVWLHDRPMFYNMSFGRQFVLQVDYHQREADDGRYDTAFGNLGTNWNVNLLTYVKVDGFATVGTDYTTNDGEIIPTAYTAGGLEATEYSPDGGVRVFDWGGTNATALFDPRTYVQLSAATTNQAVTNFNLHDQFIGDNQYYAGSNSISYPNGSVAYFNFTIAASLYPHESYSLITSARDPDGHLMTYTYGTNSGSIVLSQLVDFDGKINRFIYGNSNFPTLITEVTNINYGLAVHFNYDTNGLLTNIVDMGGISSSFAYLQTNELFYLANDVSGNPIPISTNSVTLLASMTTPYGPTSFEYYHATWPLFGDTADQNINRAITVTQPDGGKNLFMYRDNGSSYIHSYPIPVTTGNADFDANATLFGDAIDDNASSEPSKDNSFYWGPRQYVGLSTTDLTNLNSTDFADSRVRNWLHSSLDYPVALGQTLDFEQEPDPIPGFVPGRAKWFAYTGRTQNYLESTNQGLPAGSGYLASQYSVIMQNIGRNSLGKKTNVVDFGTGANGNFAIRTNQYVYDINGIDLLKHIGPDGVIQESYGYNGNHEVTSITDALSEPTSYTYNTNGQVTSITRPNGLVTTNIYGPDKFLATTYDYSGSSYYGTNTYTYTNGLVLTHTDERGLTTSNTWDGLQRLTTAANPNGTITYIYSNLDLVKVVDRMGFTNSYAYDSMRRRTNVVDALGRTNSYSYCDCGALNSIQDALGNTTSFQYDNDGRLTNTIYPDLFTVTRTYDQGDDLINVTDSSGKNTDRFYDGLLHLVATSNNVSGYQVLASANLYDLYDSATNQTDANGVSVGMTYDPLHRLASRSYPDLGVEQFGYTANVSGVTSYTNQLTNGVWTYAYDAMNRKTNEIAVHVYTNSFAYSCAGDLLTLTDGGGNTASWNYDQFGRVTNKVDAAANVIFAYRYDADNRLTNRWTPVTSNTVYSYDSVGNLKAVNYQSSSNLSFAYDALNRLTNMVDAVGTTKYAYDPVGQLLSEDGPWADDTVSYTYANRLRMTLSVAAPNASPWAQSYGYDSLDRLTNVTSPAGAFGYYFGADPATHEIVPGSLIQSLTLPNGAYITNTFDGNARLTGTYLLSSGSTTLDAESYVYNQANQRTQQVFTAGNFMNYTYDQIGELQTALGKEPGGVTNRLHEQFGYTYDAAGNLSFRTNNSLLQHFHVNNLNELNLVQSSGRLTVEGTTTSAATNVTVNTSNAFLYVDNTFASTNQPFVNEATNTYTAVARDTYGRVSTNSVSPYLVTVDSSDYDLNGNLLRDRNPGFGTNQAFAYDDENELIAVWVTNNWMSQFTYDGKMRRRIRKEFTWSSAIGNWQLTNEVHYVYDGNLVIQERDANNLPQVAYTRGADLSGKLQGAGGIGGLLARTANPSTINPQLSTSATAFYHSDGNGNVTCLIYTNQTIAAKYEYDPYGNILSQSGSLADANTYRFSSKEYHSASGLIYYLYRYYELGLQRWLNQDPIREQGFESLRYRGNELPRLIGVLNKIYGNNLYEFALNDGISGYDSFGLEGVTPPTGPNSFACALATKNYEDALKAIADKENPTTQDLITLASLRVAMEKACKPPEPPPVPQPKECPEEPKNIIHIDPPQLRQACFWATVGTVTYWVCSEGSRILFPPRNLIPVP